jgi:FdhE protein
MKTTNVISTEYIKFQETIYARYEIWHKTLSEQTIVNKEEVSGKTYPLLPQLTLNMNENDFRSFIADLLTIVKEYKPEEGRNLVKLEGLLDEETLKRWFTEAVAVNTYYFTQFAARYSLPEWLPFFAAEHAARPYLQKAAAELTDVIKDQAHTNGCPVCGEPPRLAVVNKQGKKEILCPRCHYSWGIKKISCAYCGTDNHEHIRILQVEGDERAEIHACKSCKGYTKVVYIMKLMKVPVPELLDLQFIHLDFIAQEKGFGLSESESQGTN